ncbi:hypothetical protein Ccrd_024734 [Cynara cardunculus var. scolymus]|uniref:Phosphatidic acid phosphatase type 2/haloperoxidase domain-containing protein n=1 Tax=Cynara cardunculus var. scolymus TaxID=59895 RepID=A0A103XDT4_CYNCS|nr:hypothetical protein Ccrd_024734 [Cynara cardunculus var. scolymus]
MESIIPTWQVSFLCGILTWIVVSSMFNVTQKIRSSIQPWVSRHVISGTPAILQIQKYQRGSLDAFFSGLSCVVSVPFYTGFLPLLFWVNSLFLYVETSLAEPIIKRVISIWSKFIGNSFQNNQPSCEIAKRKNTIFCRFEFLFVNFVIFAFFCWDLSGHGKLARQMTLLMAFCDYSGNCIKDVVSAPRPKSPPVRILTATKDEKENALEYGLPSSHTLNTVCLSGYLLHYVFSCLENTDASYRVASFLFVCLLVGLIGFGRIYLGMHSVIDIIGGLVLGLTILAFWLHLHESIDNFVTGVQQTYHQFHHEKVARVFTPELTIPAFAGRVLVGIPTILLVKFCSKALAKWILPITASALGIPVRSSGYVTALTVSPAVKRSNEVKQTSGYLQKMFFGSQDSFDVDTGIRLLQYAGLAWSVVDLVPSLFSHLNL